MATILLVDDDPLQAYLTMSLLSRKFSQVRRAADAAEALCYIEQPGIADTIGLIISGNHMRGLGGPAFVAELRSRLPFVPIVVLGARGESASDYPRDETHFLAYPCSGERILASTSEVLGRQRSEVA